MIYLEATALMKLVTAAPESPALATYLDAHTDTTWFTCAITRIDVHRASVAIHPDAVTQAHHVLAGLDMVAVTDRLLQIALDLNPQPQRTTDALHIAAALSAGPRLRTLVTYDPVLAAAAAGHGITATNPGGSPCFAP